MKKKNLGIRIAIYVFIGILLFLYLFPLVYAFNTSLKTKFDYMQDTISLAKSFNYKNYVEAFSKAKLSDYTVNSVFYTAVCTVVSILMAIFLAFPISRKYLKTGVVIYSVFLLGMFLPDGTIPQFKLIRELGLYNTRLGYMLALVGGGGIPLVFFVTYIKNIPREFDEAAAIDGCGYFTYMFRILIPLIKPAIASMSILTAINVWNDIIRAIIYLSSKTLYPITRGLYVFQGQYQVDIPQQMAALIMVAAPLIILYVFLQRYIMDGAIAGGVKA